MLSCLSVAQFKVASSFAESLRIPSFTVGSAQLSCPETHFLVEQSILELFGKFLYYNLHIVGLAVVENDQLSIIGFLQINRFMSKSSCQFFAI